MAHHGRTPQSVLDAPIATVVALHQTTGPNRHERRSFYEQPTNKRHFIPKKLQQEATNTPYVKPASA